MKKSTPLHRTVAKSSQWVKSVSVAIYRKPLLFLLLVVIGVSMLYTGIMMALTHALYDDQTYPNFTVASIDSGGLPLDELADRIDEQLAAATISLTVNDQVVQYSATDLGFSVDHDELRRQASAASMPQRLLPWLTQRAIDAPLVYDEQQAGEQLATITSDDFVKPVDASFSLTGGEIKITPDTPGRGVNVPGTLDTIKARLQSSVTAHEIPITVEELPANIVAEDITAQTTDIQQLTALEYSIKGQDQTYTATPADVASWIELVKDTNDTIDLTFQSAAVQKFVVAAATKESVEPTHEVTTTYKSGKSSQVTVAGKDGLTVTNQDEVVKALLEQGALGQPYIGEFTFEPIAFKKTTNQVDDTIVRGRAATYTYSVQVWGSVRSNLQTFKSLAAETLRSSRGWAAGGVVFNEVAKGGNFTLVLAEPSRVDAAAPICSAQYSCRVGRNVIINDDRWSTATPSWNAAGGSLRDYRHMVINHEVGHWLGLKHRSCTGAGNPAPVMQQQSIDLAGCKFNPWPLSSELSAL